MFDRLFKSLKMLIKGIQKTTLIDYPPNTAIVLFVGGCNFRCGYCHNASMVVGYEQLPDITEKEVFDFLESRKKWIDAVVITGGEPSLQEDLPEFISKIKKAGFLVKVDTNGTNPAMIDLLISKGLVDYIAMDIKSSLERYDAAAGVKANKDNVKKTASILMQGIVDYEFRLTVVPGLIDKDGLTTVGAWLKGADKFIIQQFRNDVVLEEKFKRIKPFSVSELNSFKEILKPYFKNVDVVGV